MKVLSDVNVIGQSSLSPDNVVIWGGRAKSRERVPPGTLGRIRHQGTE